MPQQLDLSVPLNKEQKKALKKIATDFGFHRMGIITELIRLKAIKWPLRERDVDFLKKFQKIYQNPSLLRYGLVHGRTKKEALAIVKNGGLSKLEVWFTNKIRAAYYAGKRVYVKDFVSKALAERSIPSTNKNEYWKFYKIAQPIQKRINRAYLRDREKADFRLKAITDELLNNFELTEPEKTAYEKEKTALLADFPALSKQYNQ